jgi:peptidoglycan/LPS O-acetylase OafA/YrhL
MERKSGASLRRIAILEGLRGWLSCWVMVSHIMLYCAFPLGQLSKSPFIRYFCHIPEMGRTAVWLFMILSGFVNFYLMDAKREKYHVYLTRRFLRLYPVFFILFALSIPVTYYNMDTLSHVTWAKDQWIHIQYVVTQTAFQYFYPNVIAHLTLLQGLVPRWCWPGTSAAFLGVNWSISPEWQFYILVPLLFSWASRKSGLIWMGLLACACYFSPSAHFLRAFENDNPSLLIFNFHLFYIGIASYYIYRQFILKPAGAEAKLSRL